MVAETFGLSIAVGVSEENNNMDKELGKKFGGQTLVQTLKTKVIACGDCQSSQPLPALVPLHP